MLSTVSKIQFITEPRSSFRAAATAKNETVGTFDATQVLIARKWAAPDELQAEMTVPTGWALDHLPNKDGSSFTRRARYVSVAAPTGRVMIFLLTEADLEELDDEHSRLSIKGSSPEAWLTSVPSTVNHADEQLLPQTTPTVADWVRLAARQYSLAWDEETSGGVAFRDLPIISTNDAYIVTPEDTAYYGNLTSLERISTAFTDGKPAAELTDVSGVDDRQWPAPLGDQLFKLLDGFPYTLAKSDQGATVEYRSEFELQLAPTTSPYGDGTLWWRWQVHPREDDQVVYISRQSGSITGSSTLHMTSANTDALVYPPDYSNANGDTIARRSQARFSSSTPAPGPWSSVTVKAADSGAAKPETIDSTQAFKQAAAEKAGFEPAVTIDCTANGDSESLRDETYKIRPGVTAALRFSNAVLRFAVEEVDYSYAETGWSISIPLTIRTNHVDFTYYGDESYDEYAPDDSFQGPGDTPEPPEPPEPPTPGLHAGNVDWIAGRYSSAYGAPELLIRTEDGKLYASPEWKGDAGENPNWLTLVKPVPLEPEIVNNLVTTDYTGGLLRAKGHDRDFWVITFPGSQNEPTVKHGLTPDGEKVITGSSTGSWIMTDQCAYETSGGSELTLTPVESYPMIGTEKIIQAGDYYIFVGKKQLWKWYPNGNKGPWSLGLARGGGWKQVTATGDGRYVIAIDGEGARIGGKPPTGVLEGVVGAAGNSPVYFLWKNDASHTLLVYEHDLDYDPTTLQLPFTPSAAIVSSYPTQTDNYSGVIFYGNGGAAYLHKNTDDTWEQTTITTDAVLAACGAGTPGSTILCTANGAIVGAGTVAQSTLTNKKVVSCAGRAGLSFNRTNTIVAVLVTEAGEVLTVTQQIDGSYVTDTLVSSGAKQALGLRWPCLYVVGDNAAWQVDSSTPIYEGGITGASFDERRGYLTLTLENGDAARYYPGWLTRTGDEQPAEPLAMVTHHVLPITLTNGSFWGSAGEGWTGEPSCAYTLPGLDDGLKTADGVSKTIWVTDAGDAYWISAYWLGDSSFNDSASIFLRPIKLDGYDYSGGAVLDQDISAVYHYWAIAWKADGSYRIFKISDGGDLGPSPAPDIESSGSDLHFDPEETVLGVIDGKLYTNNACYSYNGSVDSALQPELLVEPITSVAKWQYRKVARAKSDGQLVSLDDTWSDGSGTRYYRLTGFTGTVLDDLSASSDLLVTTDGYWRVKSMDNGQIVYEKVPVAAADGPLGTPLSDSSGEPIVTTTGLWTYGYPVGSDERSIYKIDDQTPEPPTGCWRPTNQYYSGPSIISTANGLYYYSYRLKHKLKKFSGEHPKEGLKVVGGSSPAVITAGGELWMLKQTGSAFRVEGDYSAYNTLIEPGTGSRITVATGDEGALAFYAVEAPKPLPCLMVGDTFYPAPPATGGLQDPSDSNIYSRAGDSTSAAACLYTVNGTRLGETSIFSSGIKGDVIDGESAGSVIVTTKTGYTMSAAIVGGEPGEIITVPRGEDKYYEFINQHLDPDLVAVIRQHGSSKPEAYYQNDSYEMVWSTLTELPASEITGWWPADQGSDTKVMSFKDGSCWLLESVGSGQPPTCTQIWAAGTGEPTDVGVANYHPVLVISPDGSSVTKISTDMAVFTAPEGKELVACKGETILGSDGTIYGLPNDGSRELWASEDDRFYKPDSETAL